LIFASFFDILFTFRNLRYEGVKEMNFIMKSVLSFGTIQVFITKFLPLFVLGIIIFGDKNQASCRKQILNWGIVICALALLIVLIVHLYFYLSLVFLENKI
jgi:hypothetical protein